MAVADETAAEASAEGAAADVAAMTFGSCVQDRVTLEATRLLLTLLLLLLLQVTDEAIGLVSRASREHAGSNACAVGISESSFSVAGSPSESNDASTLPRPMEPPLPPRPPRPPLPPLLLLLLVLMSVVIVGGTSCTGEFVLPFSS